MESEGNQRSREDAASYDLTVEEASSLFVAAGVPRSPRTIRRYCVRGHLRCVSADTETGERYMIDRVSVEERVTELRQMVASSHDRLSPDETGQDQSRPGMSDQRASELEDKVETLESENLQLRIDKAAKEHVIHQMVGERKEMIAQLTDQSRTIGTLETRLQQLEAPKAASAEDDGPVPPVNPQPEPPESPQEAL